MVQQRVRKLTSVFQGARKTAPKDANFSVFLLNMYVFFAFSE